MYCERLGLIRPPRLAGSRYRTYRAGDLQTLFLIARWRAIGLPLETIGRLLQRRDEAPQTLREHLHALETSITALRGQRRMTLELLEEPARRGGDAPLTKAALTAMFRAIGTTAAQMAAWHCHFEHSNAKAHQEFLRSPGLNRAQIGSTRRRSARAR